MVRTIRLYLEPGEHMPAIHVPYGMPKVMDVEPETARAMAADLRRQGFHVVAVEI